MIYLRIRYANEPVFTHVQRPTFKANFLAMFHQPIRLLCEAWFAVRLRRPLHMREAGFICISDSRIYHLLPIGNNFYIDKSKLEKGLGTRP